MNIGLVFGVIVAMLLMGLIIVFGYQQITNMQLLQEQAQIRKSIEGLKTAVERVHSLSGETSEPFTLTFPGGVSRVCFLPAYRDQRISIKKSRLATDLRNVIEGTSQERFQLSSLLLEMRIAPNPDGFGDIDKNLTLLVFFQSTPIPMFEQIPHLAPTRKTGPRGPEVLCVEPRSKIWLQRKFDGTGAWVDVEPS